MRILILLTIFLSILDTTLAQPEPCGVDEMTSTCADACVVCDIDGFTGRNNLTIQGQTFNGFCTTIFHNMSYIAFIAGTENLSLRVTVTNCTIGRGIEVGIFESLDCSTFTPVTACNTDVPSNGSAVFNNLVPLVIGQHYYLIMDGSSGDICDWTFDVISGSTAVGDLETSGIIDGPTELCPNLNTNYATTDIIGATFYDWTVNGVAQSGQDNELDFTFPSDGTYELCVTASNVCDEAPPSCTIINVISPQPTYLEEVLCANECYDVAGETICQSGAFDFTITLPDGCDSTIFLDLTILPEIASFIDINLCIGESFSIGNTPYSSTGIFVETIPNAIGCDSTVTLDLTMIDCEIIGTIDYGSPVCNGDNNGSLLFSLQNGIAPFAYSWDNISDASLNGTGITNLFEDILIENIPAGIYEINVMDAIGNDIVFIQEVIDPQVLTSYIDAIDYNGNNLTCYQANDGSASVIINGGLLPYDLLWSNNTSQATISNLPAGEYEVLVTDSNGCTQTATTTLTEPEPLVIAVNYIDPNCDGLETGMILLDSISGGTPPYTFALDNGNYVAVDNFQNLSAGTYSFSTVDANGCSADTTSSLSALDIPEIYMEDDQEVELGDSILISAETNNITITDISWTDVANSLTCDSCLDTYATPVNDTEYILTVTSTDGCTVSESILITVDKIRDVYIPNAFSPNGDGVNDLFFINANKSVSQINSLKIFDRWGEMVFDNTNIQANESSNGWDGLFKGQEVNPGVFAFVAEVLFLDGEALTYSGDISILK